MSLICVTILEKSITDIKAAAELAKAKGTDIIEIRLDSFTEPITDSVIKEIYSINESISLPLLLTLRAQREGGHYEESEERRLQILKECIKIGFDYIDLELSIDKSNLDVLINEAKINEVKTILSYHDLKGTPDWREIIDKIKAGTEAGGDIIKVVYQNNSIEDAYNVIKAGYAARNINYKYTVLGTGPFGYITRIMAPSIGCAIVYSALDKNKEAAPGQLDIETLTNFWDILETDRDR